MLFRSRGSAAAARASSRAPTCRSSGVHHRNHNHDDNPADGSNWELLCVYCHDNEHSRHIDHTGVSATDAEERPAPATGNPFADLRALLKKT